MFLQKFLNLNDPKKVSLHSFHSRTDTFVSFAFDDVFVPVMECVNVRNLPVIRVNEKECSPIEVLQALNYGHPQLFQTTAVWNLHTSLPVCKENSIPCDIWNESLVKEFVGNIFDKRTSWLLHGHDRFGVYEGDDPQKGGPKDFFSRLESINLRLLRESLGQLSRCCKRASLNQKFTFPHSYLVIELIRLVKFLTESVKEDIFDAEVDSMGFERFLNESSLFWKNIFGNPPNSMKVHILMYQIEKVEPNYVFDESAWKNTVYHIFLNNLDFDLILGISRPQRERRSSKPKGQLFSYLKMESTSSPVNYWRSVFLSRIGITEEETRKREALQGPLDELKASNLLAGPFRIAVTKKPKEHLTFSGVHSHPVIRILDLEQVCECFRPQRTGIAT